MPGHGKFTIYVPSNSPKKTFYEKLFSSSPFIGVDTAAAPAHFSALGNQYLIPSHQEGDAQIYPNGVYLNFQGAPNIPDEVSWTNPGDPANAYAPDIVSPGPGPGGAVNTAPNDQDPNISIDDLKPGYTPGKIGTDADGGTGTANPNTTSGIVHKQLGTTYAPGSSQTAQ